MFSPDWEDGCPSCSAGAEECSDGLQEHLHSRDTSLAYVSRAPLAKIEAYKARRAGRSPGTPPTAATSTTTSTSRSTSPWPRSSTTSGRRRSRGGRDRWLVEGDQPIEQPGTSCFLRDGDRVFHTYSMYARGAEMLGGSYYFLDLTALGRQEDWEEPKGRAGQRGVRRRTSAPDPPALPLLLELRHPLEDAAALDRALADDRGDDALRALRARPAPCRAPS